MSSSLNRAALYAQGWVLHGLSTVVYLQQTAYVCYSITLRGLHFTHQAGAISFTKLSVRQRCALLRLRLFGDQCIVEMLLLSKNKHPRAFY